MSKKIEAIVMAAGMGKRLGELSEKVPKALVKVAGKELLKWVLDFLDHPSVSKITVVGGCHHGKVERLLKSEFRDVDILNNPEYEKGNILSLKVALEHISQDFLLCNVDHIFPKGMLDHIIKNCRQLSAICDGDRKLGNDDMKVKLDDEGNLRRINKKLTDYDMGYIGMTYCPSIEIERYKNFVKTQIEKGGERSAAEDVLDLMASGGVKISICDCSNWKWFEIDTPEERSAAEKALTGGV